jgi:hypothetical protein
MAGAEMQEIDDSSRGSQRHISCPIGQIMPDPRA